MNDATAIEIPSDIYGDLNPDPAQVQAVENAARNKVSIITGGPGVGKTWVINLIIKMFRALGLNILCCAPTGKAAIRMTEQTGHPASTIHRLLGWTPDGFKHDSSEPEFEDGKWVRGGPLTCDVVIVDETSMVDTELFYNLVDAIPDHARLIIVGDVDQLPSIGAGRVLYDLITNGKVPTTRLTKIFRQASESRIPYVARDINSGEMPDLSNEACKDSDVIFAEANDPQAVLNGIVSAFKTHLPNRGYGIDDIQVIAPQRNQACGVENVNEVLQRELNPAASDKRNLVHVGNGYKVARGDRVIHTRNNYNLRARDDQEGAGTFNGEIGKVVDATWRGLSQDALRRLEDTADRKDFVWGVSGRGDQAVEMRNKKVVVVVDYGDRLVAYSQDEARDLDLAYAITIHKSQGSQFKAVVMPTHSCHHFMLTRPLIYTGITRASEMLLMVGESMAVAKAANNLRGVHRRTNLQHHLANTEAPKAEAVSLEAVA